MKPWELFERAGRATMDFGFSRFLERFEHHYGAAAEKLLVGIVGAAVIATAFSLLWAHLISPIISTALRLPEPTPTWDEAVRRYAAYVSIGVAIVFGLAVLNLYRSALRDTRQIRDEVLKLREEAKRKFRPSESE